MKVFEDAVDEMMNVINDTNVISNNTMIYSYHGAINLMHVCIYAVEVFISSLTWKVARLPCKDVRYRSLVRFLPEGNFILKR